MYANEKGKAMGIVKYYRVVKFNLIGLIVLLITLFSIALIISAYRYANADAFAGELAVEKRITKWEAQQRFGMCATAAITSHCFTFIMHVIIANSHVNLI